MGKFFKKFKIQRKIIAFLAKLHFYGNPSVKLKIVGVTGTNGKTTTSTLLYKIAERLGYKAGLIGTVENIVAGKHYVATHTTPGPIFLNKLLKQMVAEGCEYVFMEVSSHALDQGRVAGINFAGGIFTNLTHDHLDYHKSFKNYFLAKKKFFDMLPSTAFALSNSDDEHGRRIVESTKAKPAFYGFEPETDYRANILEMTFSSTLISINNTKIKSSLLGRFNAYNILSVWSACELLGFDMGKVQEIVEDIKPPRGRFEHFTSSNGILGIVDYAHTPDALEKIFSAVKDFNTNKGKIISVFGCGGDRDPLKRRIMGKIGALHSDTAIFTSDNPRSEPPEKIIDAMRTDLSMGLTEKTLFITDRREAIKKAVSLASSGDIILLAGKGHETYQEIKGVKHHFDDAEELQKAFIEAK